MGDFEDTFGAGADAVDIIDGFACSHRQVSVREKKILEPSVPYILDRKIVWLSEADCTMPDTRLPGTYPPGLNFLYSQEADAYFEDEKRIGRLECVETMLYKDDHTGLLLHGGFPSLWFSRPDGSLISRNPSQVRLPYWAQHIDLKWKPPFVQATGKQRLKTEEDQMPIFYFRHCTILPLEQLSEKLMALRGLDPEWITGMDVVSGMLGYIHALLPANSREKAQVLPFIRKDIETHTKIMEIETGFKFSLI